MIERIMRMAYRFDSWLFRKCPSRSPQFGFYCECRRNPKHEIHQFLMWRWKDNRETTEPFANY